ncbi:hypothetical protein Gotri_002555 [Gossypium trilobum]|uniref:RNase H type-1 domain-containing protein n=1 Tax=Gossypium trilobum TaxID=34281 RepID=A0A7J9F8N7_9ROSI|nr:hypothetical protein [Gossypium trilobum]
MVGNGLPGYLEIAPVYSVDISTSPPLGSNVKINFDVAFNQGQARLGSGVVAKNTLGEILALEMVLHKAIASQFANGLAHNLATECLKREMEIYLVAGVSMAVDEAVRRRRQREPD